MLQTLRAPHSLLWVTLALLGAALALLGAALALLGAATDAQSETVVLARGLAEDVIAAARLPGLSVAIALDGKLVFAEGFGYADLERKTPVTPKTRYRAASVSKLVTVTALAKLVERRKLALDGSIHEHVSYDPPDGADITFRQLAGHLAGVEHYSRADRADVMARHHERATDALAVFAHKPLLFEPGTDYHYSTHGYTLLGAALEGASGKDFLALLSGKLFRPLGMNGTGPDVRRTAKPIQAAKPDQAAPTDATKTDVATLYDLGESGPVAVASPEDPSYKWPAGGLLSTPTDLVRLGRAYLDGFVQAELAKEWWTPQSLANGRELDIGIGWRLSSDRDGRRVVEHAGSMEGARSVLCVYPDHGLVIALMTNTSWNGRIEQTARLFALPFLVPAGKEVPVEGEFAVTGKSPQGPIDGSVSLAHGHGALVHATGKSWYVRHLRGNDYALSTEAGQLWLELAPTAEGCEGLGYGLQPGTAAAHPAKEPVVVLQAVRKAAPR